jgi:hypothetical protein
MRSNGLTGASGQQDDSHDADGDAGPTERVHLLAEEQPACQGDNKD